MAHTTTTWTATLTGNVIVEAGGSGAGGYLGGFGGGGGGAYARTAGIAIVSGVGYNVQFGNGGTPNNNGDESNFGAGANPNAVGGHASILGAGGLGGTAAASTGDVTKSGGDGSVASGSQGGGGGSAADDLNDGHNGTINGGGGANPRGGKGGDGAVDALSDGSIGLTPGGGGGSSIGGAGAHGGEGYVLIWEDLGVWPPCGQTPIASFGSPPISKWAACSVTRVYWYIIS